MRVGDPLAVHHVWIVGATFQGRQSLVNLAVGLDPRPVVWATIVAVDGGDIVRRVGSRLKCDDGPCPSGISCDSGGECRCEGGSEKEEESRVSSG